MTLAVAVICPFPFNDDRSVRKNGIVFAADTRYSYEDRPPFDRGVKIVQLGRSAGCMFAGNVACAANVATHLNRVFAKPIGAFSEGMLGEEIDEALLDADRESRIADLQVDYAMLLAFATQDGVPVLAALGPRRPLQVSTCGWGAMIGDRRPGDEEAFELVLRQTIMMKGMLQGYVNNSTTWMFPVGEAFSDFIERHPRASVGGALQIAAVSTHDGFRQNDILRGRRRTAGDGFDWELKTPPVSFD